MSLNINLKLSKNQQNIFDQYKTAFGESFAEKDLVTIENNTSRVKDLKNVAKVVFEYIYACALNGRGIWMAHETLARKLGYCVTSIKNALDYLRELGLVSWVSGKKNYTTNQYYVHISLLVHEAVRILKDYLQCAWLAWCRRLIRFCVNITILSGAISTPVNNDSDRECLPRKSNIYKEYNNQLRSESISLQKAKQSKAEVIRMRERGLLAKRREMSISKEQFAEWEKKGFYFSLPAQRDLQPFKKEVIEIAIDRYPLRAQKTNIIKPFNFFVKICHEISDEGYYAKDKEAASAFAAQHGISIFEKPDLKYVAVVSDNALLKTTSNGKTTAFTTFVDPNGIEYWVDPLGGKHRKEVNIPKHVEDSGAEKIAYVMDNLASGEWYSQIPDRELADQSAKGWVAVGEAQERGDEDLKRQVFFQTLASMVGSGHGNMAQSLLNLAKNTSNLHKEENIDALHHPPPDLSL
jgi:hypothetical protein